MKLIQRILLLITFIASGIILIKIPWEITTSIIKTWTNPIMKQIGVVGMQMLICVLIFSMVYLFITKIDKKHLKDFGIFFNNRAIIHIVTGFSLTTICALLTWGVILIQYKPTYTTLSENSTFTALTILLTFFATCFQSFYEELWFRSWALKTLSNILNEKSVIVIMGIAFGAIHLLNPNYNVISVTSASLGGILMSSAYFRFKSIWVSTGLHLGWNFTLGGLVYNRYLFKVIFKDNIVANQYTGGEASLAGCIFIAISCIIIWIIPIKNKN